MQDIQLLTFLHSHKSHLFLTTTANVVCSGACPAALGDGAALCSEDESRPFAGGGRTRSRPGPWPPGGLSGQLRARRGRAIPTPARSRSTKTRAGPAHRLGIWCSKVMEADCNCLAGSPRGTGFLPFLCSPALGWRARSSPPAEASARGAAHPPLI